MFFSAPGMFIEDDFVGALALERTTKIQPLVWKWVK